MPNYDAEKWVSWTLAVLKQLPMFKQMNGLMDEYIRPFLVSGITLIAGLKNGAVFRLDSSSLESYWCFQREESSYPAVTVAPNRQTIAVTYCNARWKEALMMLDMTSGRCMWATEFRDCPIMISFAPDSETLAMAHWGGYLMLDTRSGACLWNKQDDLMDDDLLSIDFAPSGLTIVVISDGLVKVLNAVLGEIVWQQSDNAVFFMTAAKYDSSGQMILARHSHGLIAFSAADGQELGQWSSDESYVGDFTSSPDGTCIAVGLSKGAAMLDSASGCDMWHNREQKIFDTDKVVFALEGNVFVCGGSQSVAFDAACGDMLWCMDNNPAEDMRTGARNDKHIASISNIIAAANHNEIHLFNALNADLACVTSFSSEVISLAFCNKLEVLAKIPLTPGIETTMQSSHEKVTIEVRHSEPAIVPDASDTIVADILWTQQVEQSIMAGEHVIVHRNAIDVWMEDHDDFDTWINISKHQALTSCEFGDRIYIISFTRSGSILEAKLHEGRELEPVRQEMLQIGQTCRLPGGASIFVYPQQYNSVVSVIYKCGLQPHHVVIAQAFLPLLQDAVRTIRCRDKIKIRSMVTLACVSDDGSGIVTMERMFLQFCQPRDTDEIATQSTSQARGILNQRLLHSSPAV